MADFETKTHTISKSNSHEGMYIFSSKKDNTFFAITASRDWITNNSEILPYPALKRTHRLKRLK